jgi:hypothetical protein
MPVVGLWLFHDGMDLKTQLVIEVERGHLTVDFKLTHGITAGCRPHSIFLIMIICGDFSKNEVFRSVMAHGPLEVRGSPITVYPNLTINDPNV